MIRTYIYVWLLATLHCLNGAPEPFIPLPIVCFWCECMYTRSNKSYNNGNNYIELVVKPSLKTILMKWMNHVKLFEIFIRNYFCYSKFSPQRALCVGCAIRDANFVLGRIRQMQKPTLQLFLIIILIDIWTLQAMHAIEELPMLLRSHKWKFNASHLWLRRIWLRSPAQNTQRILLLWNNWFRKLFSWIGKNVLFHRSRLNGIHPHHSTITWCLVVQNFWLWFR